MPEVVAGTADAPRPTTDLRHKRILVTGATGMLGRALLEHLAEAECLNVTPVSRSDVDLLHLESTVEVFERARPDVVFHLAARVAGIGGNMAEPATMFFENVTINTNVVEASRRAGARKIVAASSAAIYSDSVTLPMLEQDLWLGPPHASEAAYGHAKRAMLAHLEACKAQYGLGYAYCILTNTFGRHDRFDEQHGHVLPTLISKFHRGRRDGGPVTIWGTGTPERDFLYAMDVAKALHLIAQNADGPLNVASGSQISIRGLVEVVREVSGYTGEIVWDDSKPNGQELRKYDVSRLRATGFEPAYTLRQAVAETYAWYEGNAAIARR